MFWCALSRCLQRLLQDLPSFDLHIIFDSVLWNVARLSYTVLVFIALGFQLQVPFDPCISGSFPDVRDTRCLTESILCFNNVHHVINPKVPFAWFPCKHLAQSCWFYANNCVNLRKSTRAIPLYLCAIPRNSHRKFCLPSEVLRCRWWFLPSTDTYIGWTFFTVFCTSFSTQNRDDHETKDGKRWHDLNEYIHDRTI